MSSRKGAKGAKSGGIGRYFSFRPWRLGEINFLELVGCIIGLRNKGKDTSRKDAKGAKFGENSKKSLFAGLASWRENLC